MTRIYKKYKFFELSLQVNRLLIDENEMNLLFFLPGSSPPRSH